jgi:tetratricopeptide (TPR) repeat protein
MRLRPLLLAVTIALLLFASALVRAEPENITVGEVALTPSYCHDVLDPTYKIGGPKTEYWVSRMGRGFLAVHHYCWGLINARRAQMPGVKPVIRAGLLQSVVGDYMFVIHNSPRDFVLLPEIWTRIGETQLLRSQPGAAYDAFARAREIKPDYWPAYSRWAAVLIRSGQKAEAKELVESGLQQAPDSEELREQFRKLGGDPSRIRSVPKASESTNATAEDAAPAASASEGQTK